MNAYRQAVAVLPPKLRMPALSVDEQYMKRAEEIRIRVGRQPALVLPEGEWVIPHAPQVDSDDMEQLVQISSNWSIHTVLDYIREGFLPLEGGHRLGLCGMAVIKDGQIHTMREISSGNLRIARQHIGCAGDIVSRLFDKDQLQNTLILAPPGAGKTTLLRDMIRSLSYGPKGFQSFRVGLVDERGEIAAMHRGVPQLDVGPHTDVLDACPKAEGIELLLRAMNPQVIAVDEITAAEDIAAMSRAANCGVSMIATIHAADRQELLAKPLFRRLQRQKVFRKLITIRADHGERRYRMEELV